MCLEMCEQLEFSKDVTNQQCVANWWTNFFSASNRMYKWYSETRGQQCNTSWASINLLYRIVIIVQEFEFDIVCICYSLYEHTILICRWKWSLSTAPTLKDCDWTLLRIIIDSHTCVCVWCVCTYVAFQQQNDHWVMNINLCSELKISLMF